MGILNVTPDSFSDGGRYSDTHKAVARALRMVEEGAAIIDVGGESTRPGAQAVPAPVQIERVVPVIAAIAARSPVAISIDTSLPEVMQAAVAAGACIINDVYALRLPGARECAGETRAGVCLMHMKGEPRTMQHSPQYDDVMAEVLAFLEAQLDACRIAGIPTEAMAIDPGFGFGKGFEHNMQLLRNLRDFSRLGVPLLIGLSRKSLVGKLLGKTVDERLYGGLGLVALAVAGGARIIRTHDVGPTVDVVRIVDAVWGGTV